MSSAEDTTSSQDALEGAVAVIVPVRSFRGALSRLAGVLGEARCRQLMTVMARRVVTAAHGLAVYVASDDPEVAAFAEELSAGVVRVGRPGLSVAAMAAMQQAGRDGFAHALVAHGDLAFAESLRPAVGPGLTIVPDRRDDGSNVVCVPTSSGFEFQYGPGSFGRHLAQARRLGLSVNVVRDPSLSLDIDNPQDLLSLPMVDRRALGLDSVAGLVTR